jgi:hypothetical protein
MDLASVLNQLKSERQRLDKAIKALEDVAGKKSAGNSHAVHRTRLSAAARAKIGAAQRKRWAKVRAAKKKG